MKYVNASFILMVLCGACRLARVTAVGAGGYEGFPAAHVLASQRPLE